MSLRLFAFALLCVAASSAEAQEAVTGNLPARPTTQSDSVSTHSAWLDLRQNAAANSTTQSAPAWVESVALVPVPANGGNVAHTIFRIRVKRPREDARMLLLRLFFDDKPDARPSITAWDESGTVVLRSGELGAGIDLATSDTVTLPMIGVSAIDIEVAGDGTNVRGVFMDWMAERNIAHPLSADERDIMPQPFAAAAPLHSPENDSEKFGTVTASLAPDTIRIGASVQQGAAFQFGLESQPLMALLTFEVSTARVDSPPIVYVNGENLGAVSLVLPELADPAYRGEAQRLVSPMRFHYTGWLRAQKLVPASYLKPGTNDVIVIGGAETPISAIRATQIELKYLWDKSDYVLDPK